MSLDIINLFPTEVLCMVFDYLDPSECSTAAGVCTRWSEILSSYRQADELVTGSCLSVEDLAEENLAELKQYRWVIIYTDRFKTPEEKLMLEKYLFTEELLENLEEFELNGLCYSSEGERELYLPNVRKIRIAGDSEPPEQNAVPCRIVAPKLHTFHQASDTIREPLVWFSRQIVDLLAIHCEKAHLLSMMGDLSFGNLRSLKLDVLGGSPLLETDFSDKLRATFGRLNQLKITDWKSIFYPVLGTVLAEAKNLQVLEIWGRAISANAFRQLNELKQLKQLTLNVTIEDPQMTLSLPKLAKLEIYFMDLVPLGNVPCLKSLLIAVQPNSYKNLDLASHLRPIARQLEKLELSRVFLDADCIEAICTLENLSSLKLSEVKVEFSSVEQLFRNMKNLRLVKFEYCRMAERVVICRGCCSNCSCDYCTDAEDGQFARDGRRPTERYQEFYETLRSRHVDCVIRVADKGQLVKCLKVTRYSEQDSEDEGHGA